MIHGIYRRLFGLLVAVTTSVQAQQVSPITVGKPFPRIEGKSLAGTGVVAPDDFKGKVTLITAAFVEPAQQQIDTWAKPTLARYLDNAKFGYLELPILSKGAEFFGLGSAWIDGGMRSGIDPRLHGSVMTLYTDLDPYYTMMGADKKAAYIFLLDAKGTVIGRWVGAAKPGDVEALHKQIDAMMAPGSK